MSAADEFSRNVEKLESLIKQAKEVNREGREILKDTRLARKELLDAKAEVEAWAVKTAEDRFQPAISGEFEKLIPQIKDLYKRVESKVDILIKPVELIEQLSEKQENRVLAISRMIDVLEGSKSLQISVRVANAGLADP